MKYKDIPRFYLVNGWIAQLRLSSTFPNSSILEVNWIQSQESWQMTPNGCKLTIGLVLFCVFFG